MEFYTLQGWVVMRPCVHPAHPIGVCLGLPPPAVRHMMEVGPHCACSTQGPVVVNRVSLWLSGVSLGVGRCKQGAQQLQGWILHRGELLPGPSFPGGTWGPGMQPGTRVCPQWRAGPVADVNPALQINNQPRGEDKRLLCSRAGRLRTQPGASPSLGVGGSKQPPPAPCLWGPPHQPGDGAVGCVGAQSGGKEGIWHLDTC